MRREEHGMEESRGPLGVPPWAAPHGVFFEHWSLGLPLGLLSWAPYGLDDLGFKTMWASLDSLGLAQLTSSRVNDTLLRIDAIIERGNCIDGAEKALQIEDFESTVKYIQTFLQIDAKYRDSGSDQRELYLASKKQLEGIVRKRLSAAVGLNSSRNQSSNSNPLPLLLNQNQVNFVACLKNLFKDIVLAIEENNEILRSNLYGEAGIVYAICELQDECDSRGSLILKKYMEYQKLVKLTFEINTSKGNLLSVGVQGPEPRDIELYLEEILQLKQLGKDYTNYIVSKIRGLSSVDQELLPRATRAFRSGNFSKFVQDITC
ncbi:unnamed protein product [Ilex paraguariensis]|uniref:Conserved oligomeric Golgi complex subunit 4 n=1 Tax=Ilex paraguariensis TaxID=185542 RepID=A0ABC8RV12_9AQUA